MKVGDLVRVKDTGIDDHDVSRHLRGDWCNCSVTCIKFEVIFMITGTFRLSEPYNIQCIHLSVDIEVISEAC